MSWILFFLVIALIFFLVELIVPGGILGILGVISICAASIAAFVNYGTVSALTVFVGGALLSLLFFLFEMKFIASSHWGKKWFQHHEVSATMVGYDNVEALIGMTGETITVMKPAGKVLIDGIVYEAASLDGYLSKGTSVVVKKADRALIRVTSL